MTCVATRKLAALAAIVSNLLANVRIVTTGVGIVATPNSKHVLDGRPDLFLRFTVVNLHSEITQSDNCKMRMDHTMEQWEDRNRF